jgi:serine/threonine-protein kinase
MGRVLLAHDPVLDRDVALKHLRDDLGISWDQRGALIERMRQEARASARVSHPNIVTLHDMGEDDAVGLYLVFEHAEGDTLKERLTRGPMSAEAVAKLARALGDALSTAHHAGVLHRDVKPENILLTKTGPKIADFGIARVPDSTLTRDGGLLGTPAYSAPEAISDGAFSPASDQFSLAATLWEALAGRRAFPGDDAVAVASRIALEEPPAIAAVCGVDPHVDTVFARGLSKNPAARFGSCAEFGAALADVLERSPRASLTTAPDQYHLAAQRKKDSGRMVRVALGAAALGGVVALVAVQAVSRTRSGGELPLPIVPVVLSAKANAEHLASASRSKAQRASSVVARPRDTANRASPTRADAVPAESAEPSPPSSASAPVPSTPAPAGSDEAPEPSVP